MALINLLQKTYENLAVEPPEELLPISHSTQDAQIEITINLSGEFCFANVVDKDNRVTLIPVTEDSGSRSSGIAPHPLCDKLKYVAGDYIKYSDDKNSEPFEEYIKQLREWCESEYSNKKINAIYKYLSKKSLIKDLIDNKILICSPDNKLLKKWNGSKETMPKIFSVCSQTQADAFVRFSVIGDYENNTPAVWQDKQIIKDFQNYYKSKNKDKRFCFITGNEVYCSSKHPSKLRNTGDKAKIISANDSIGYTYRGRFTQPEQAFSISYDVSQKAHNALRYLIKNQGTHNTGSKVFVLWGTRNENVPDIESSTDYFLYGDDNSKFLDTKECFAKDFNSAVNGYKANIKADTELALIGLDAATTGRLAITFFREYKGIQGNELIDRIAKWHSIGIWKHYIYSKKAEKKIHILGIPSLRDIAETAFGTQQNNTIKADDKLKGKAVERLIACVCDKAKIPRDIVNILIRKSMHPQNYDIRNWEHVLTVTCSMYCKYLKDYLEEEWSMDIKECKDISYNLGRYLAVADRIERYANDDYKDEKETNAMKYFTRFTQYPNETLLLIRQKLNPYIKKLGAKSLYLTKIGEEILSKIDPDELASTKKLDGKFVLGYDSQRQALKNRNNKEEQ